MARPSPSTTSSFSIAPGSVHALLGENGAGKSTIVKLLSGLAQPDAGGFRLFGEPARLSSPRDAQAQGVQTAFQEMTLVKTSPFSTTCSCRTVLPALRA